VNHENDVALARRLDAMGRDLAHAEPPAPPAAFIGAVARRRTARRLAFGAPALAAAGLVLFWAVRVQVAPAPAPTPGPIAVTPRAQTEPAHGAPTVANLGRDASNVDRFPTGGFGGSMDPAPSSYHPGPSPALGDILRETVPR